MYCIRKIKDDLIWVGANDRRLAMFEGIYAVPNGVAYNSYLLLDEKTVVFDTVDKAVHTRYMENIKQALDGRELDYLIVQHMEPDHSASIIELLTKYKKAKIVCNKKSMVMIKNFFGCDFTNRAIIVEDGDSLDIGRRKLNFIFAPMVHWPEVMVTYESTDKVLFSADAFGTFGALNGAIFADEVDFDKDYMDETRRYYTNIVGKYGVQTKALLDKASKLDIEMICPLHGFVWRQNLEKTLSIHEKWSTYEPEEKGVLIAYASVYGNTENAAEILSAKLREKGIKTSMFDVSVIHESYIVAEAFKWSHLLFASTTYNNGIFVAMEELLCDLVAHNIQNRTVAIIENGSWSPQAGRLIAQKFEKSKNINILDNVVTVLSGVSESNFEELEKLAERIACDVKA